MLSRRQFFTISLIMLVLFFLFQVTSVLKEQWNQYDKNEYAQTAYTKLSAGDLYRINRSAKTISESYVLLIGDAQEDALGKMVKLWCEYAKRDLLCCQSLEEVPWEEIPTPKLILLDSNYLDFAGETEQLAKLAEKGTDLIFCNLPDVNTIAENKALRELLGIFSVRKAEVQLLGIDLFEGFLLGGRAIYQVEEDAGEEEKKQQDLDLTVPWYEVRSGTKTYMLGLIDKEAYEAKNEKMKLENENFPSIIWRNSVGDGHVFAVNGNYMEDVTALGILSGMVYELEEYTVYPVINAQSFVVANYAGLSSESDDTMQQLYSRSQKAAFQDIFWPSLTSISSRSQDRPTVFLAPKLDYDTQEAPDGKQLVFYLKMFREGKIENGLSLYCTSQTPLTKKLEADEAFYKENVPDYTIRALYVDRDNEKEYGRIKQARALESVRTVYMGYDGTDAPAYYREKEVTKQRATQDGFVHTFSDNLRLRSLETALGYSSIMVDMNRLVMPEDIQEDVWEKCSERLASYTVTYWKPFQAFDKTTLSEGDQRIRRFFAISGTGSQYEKKDNRITLKIDSFDGQAFFILRTHNKSVSGVKGGSFREIEKHAYLITADQKDVTITLENDISLFYTDKG